MFGRATIRLGIGPHSSSFYIFMSLLICTGRTVDRMNTVNGSSDVFACKVGPSGVRLNSLII